ncbi:MAG: hypothetical protein DMF64_12715 [Acidobacteria bacterium]|nr:MAG: hypothetical protein DMF64_12715 [Acidobacteriota bacterium]
MSERDDIFDELIGADTDDTDEFEDEPEEDDDAETLALRTVVLRKREMIALLGLKHTTRGSMIVHVDPRQTLPVAKTYEDMDEAAHWFRRSLATSLDNGWRIVYDGAPLVG